jgi:hypothetical protein
MRAGNYIGVNDIDENGPRSYAQLSGTFIAKAELLTGIMALTGNEGTNTNRPIAITTINNILFI